MRIGAFLHQESEGGQEADHCSVGDRSVERMRTAPGSMNISCWRLLFVSYMSQDEIMMAKADGSPTSLVMPELITP